ncbi:methyl-accepting chemotaxis protein [Brasilonema sp. CT11]|nr:methyl-accepting chemotaxis protein [Brasilonema sp. CT11]
MFENWKYRDRIFVKSSTVAILSLIFSVTVIVNATRTNQVFDDLRTSQSAILETDDMILRISLMARQVRGYLLVRNADGALETYAKLKKNFQDSAERAQKIIQDGPQAEQLRRMIQLEDQFDALAQRTFRLEDANQHKEAVDSYLRDSKILVGDFDQLNQQFKQAKIQEISNLSQTTRNNLTFLMAAGIIIPLLVIAAAFGGTLFIIQQLKKRIAGVVGVAERISSGDFTTQAQVTQEQDEMEPLVIAFGSMTKNLNSLIHQVQKSGIQVTTSATQIAASGKQLEATVAEQVASTNEVLATAKQIASTSGKLVKTMDEVAETSASTASAGDNSQKDLSRMEATMRQLAGATGTISAKLGVISDKANNINSIVTTITKVADQTNLLSLNAAIEAEKAGEYGMGFAVVAREIRRLADQTAVATLDIESMVKEMQSAVSTGVMEMDKFTQQVGHGVEDVQNISIQIGEIIEQVQALTPRFQMVSGGMEAQSESAVQINEAMVQLSEASSQTADSLRGINIAIAQLNDAAHSLRQEVSQFKVKS